jgi:hypothetical protein
MRPRQKTIQQTGLFAIARCGHSPRPLCARPQRWSNYRIGFPGIHREVFSLVQCGEIDCSYRFRIARRFDNEV